MPPPPFGGAEIVQYIPGQTIDESLYQNPHTVYAIDMVGGFHFQPRPYRAGKAFTVDVYLDNLDDSYPRVATFTNSSMSGDGKYSIILVTPSSVVTRDEQGAALLRNVFRFEYSLNDGRYTARPVASHVPCAPNVYYALDMARINAGTVKFRKFAY